MCFFFHALLMILKLSNSFSLVFFLIDVDIVDLMNLTSHIILGNIKLVTILCERIVMKDHVIDFNMKPTQKKTIDVNLIIVGNPKS
jgi:hypothetical protein